MNSKRRVRSGPGSERQGRAGSQNTFVSREGSRVSSKIENQPSLPKCGAAELDPELFANEAAAAIACNKIRRGDFSQASVSAPQDKMHFVRVLVKID